jgi:hypothetical protein
MGGVVYSCKMEKETLLLKKNPNQSYYWRKKSAT